MSLFIDTLADGDNVYEYGICSYDDDSGNEYGCGMEYAYYVGTQTLESWHTAVGLVTTHHNFTDCDIANLEDAHSSHANIPSHEFL